MWAKSSNVSPKRQQSAKRKQRRKVQRIFTDGSIEELHQLLKSMKHLPILLVLILASCAKDNPSPPSNGGTPPIAYNPAIVPAQYTPNGTIPRGPVTFRWGAVPGVDKYEIQYQRDVAGQPGSYQAWSGQFSEDTVKVVPLPSGLINAGRWRVWTKGADGTYGTQSGWMYFEFE